MILKQCPQCNAVFQCKESIECWCNKGLWGPDRNKAVILIDTVSDRCKCPSCLKQQI